MAPKRRDHTPRWQRGFLGHYALTVLDRTPIYAFQLSTQIASRSHGLWSPSPGAIYPAFRALEARGLIRTERRAGRKLYFITPAGRRHLSEIRAARAKWAERFGGSWRLMLDMVEPERRVESGLRRLRQALSMSEALVTGEEESLTPAERAQLRRGVLAEIEGTAQRLRAAPSPHGLARSRRSR